MFFLLCEAKMRSFIDSRRVSLLPVALVALLTISGSAQSANILFVGEPDEPAMPDPGGVSQLTLGGRVSGAARRAATTVREWFEPGRVAPARLAATAFVAGFSVASLLAYLVSQFVDIGVVHLLRRASGGPRCLHYCS